MADFGLERDVGQFSSTGSWLWNILLYSCSKGYFPQPTSSGIIYYLDLDLGITTTSLGSSLVEFTVIKIDQLRGTSLLSDSLEYSEPYYRGG
jgi:hypothetical protein